MAQNPHFAALFRNTAVNAMTALLNNGYLRIYDATGGGQPADADTAIPGTAVKLAELRFASTAFPSASSGAASANAIASTTALATGNASFFVVLESDGTTVAAMGSCGTSSADLVWNSVALQIGAQVSITSFQVSIPA